MVLYLLPLTRSVRDTLTHGVNLWIEGFTPWVGCDEATCQARTTSDRNSNSYCYWRLAGQEELHVCLRKGSTGSTSHFCNRCTRVAQSGRTHERPVVIHTGLASWQHWVYATSYGGSHQMSWLGFFRVPHQSQGSRALSLPTQTSEDQELSSN